MISIAAWLGGGGGHCAASKPLSLSSFLEWTSQSDRSDRTYRPVSRDTFIQRRFASREKREIDVSRLTEALSDRLRRGSKRERGREDEGEE